MEEKFKIQSEQYAFPYHHLVDLKNKTFHRGMPRGLDYFNYISMVLGLINRHIKDDILDIGCGDGFLLYNLFLTGERPEIAAVGIDIDEKPIKFAQAFSFNMPNLTFIHDDIKNYDRKFKLITVIETLEHIPDDEIASFIEQIDLHLAPGGILIVSVPSKNIPLNYKHYRHYNVEMLKKYFNSYDILEEQFITWKCFPYKIIESILYNGKFILNFSGFRDILFKLNKRFFFSTKEGKCSHLVLTFKKR